MYTARAAVWKLAVLTHALWHLSRSCGLTAFLDTEKNTFVPVNHSVLLFLKLTF